MKNVAILPIVVALVVGPISGCSASASLGASGSPSISSAVSSVAPEQSPSSLASASRASAPSVIALIPGFKVTDNSGYSFSYSDITVAYSTPPTIDIANAKPGRALVSDGELSYSFSLTNTTPQRNASLESLT